MLMHWLNLEPPNLLTMLILLTRRLWWRTCGFLTRPSFFVINLFVVNIISTLVYQKQNTSKKNSKISKLLSLLYMRFINDIIIIKEYIKITKCCEPHQV